MRGGTDCASIYPLAKGLPIMHIRQARKVRAAILWQKGWRRGKNQQILPPLPLNAASSAVGTGYASMYSLANRFSATRAELAASAVSPFGYNVVYGTDRFYCPIIRVWCVLRRNNAACLIVRAMFCLGGMGALSPCSPRPFWQSMKAVLPPHHSGIEPSH